MEKKKMMKNVTKVLRSSDDERTLDFFELQSELNRFGKTPSKPNLHQNHRLRLPLQDPLVSVVSITRSLNKAFHGSLTM